MWELLFTETDLVGVNFMEMTAVGTARGPEDGSSTPQSTIMRNVMRDRACRVAASLVRSILPASAYAAQACSQLYTIRVTH